MDGVMVINNTKIYTHECAMQSTKTNIPIYITWNPECLNIICLAIGQTVVDSLRIS